MTIKDSNTRITVVLDTRTKEVLDLVAKNEHRTLTNKIAQILTSYVDGMTDIAIQMMESGEIDDDDILEKFLNISYREYCKKMAARINYIGAEAGMVVNKKESQDETTSQL